MDVLECIKTRRSVRKFTEQPIEFEKLGKILEAGIYAPSAGNIQNYRFILVLEKDLLKKLYDHCMHQEVIYHAQAAIVVIGEDDKAERMYGLRGRRLYSIQNCASATENMLLAAHALGLGACWIGAFDEDKVRTLFNIEEHARPQSIIALGYPDEEPVVKKKELTSFVYFNSYGLKVQDVNTLLRDYSLNWPKGVDAMRTSTERGVKKIKKAFDDWREKHKQTKKEEKPESKNHQPPHK